MIDCIAHIGRNRSIINGVRADRSDLSRIPMGLKRANRSSYNVKHARLRRSSEQIGGGGERKKMGKRRREEERKRGQLLVTITST